MPIIFEKLSFAEGDPDLLKRVRQEIEAKTSYVLWLQGEMGAGKTSFVRAYLYAMGLDERSPVVSPTYTIMNEYKIGENWYAHLDLYRAEENFSLAELGVYDVRTYKGIFVEWPEQGGENERLIPTHKLTIEADGERRSYTLQAF